MKVGRILGVYGLCSAAFLSAVLLAGAANTHGTYDDTTWTTNVEGSSRTSKRALPEWMQTGLEFAYHADFDLISNYGYNSKRGFPSNNLRQTAGADQPGFNSSVTSSYLSFDGVSDYMTITNLILNPITKFTVMVRARITGNHAYPDTLFSIRGDSIENVIALVNNNNSNSFYLLVQTGNGSGDFGAWRGSNGIVKNTIQTFGFTWQTGEVGKLYYDGIQTPTDQLTKTNVPQCVPNDTMYISEDEVNPGELKMDLFDMLVYPDRRFASNEMLDAAIYLNSHY